MGPLITFLSDYPPEDEFVGICHAVMTGVAPEAHVIDLAHGVPGVRAGSEILAQCVPYAADAVHLAVVDPAVGTSRRGVVLVTARGPLVGPDNGLLLPAVDILGGPVSAFELADRRFRLEPVSPTFHGRDVFAPAAAHLASGVAPEEFGPAVPASELVRLPPPRVEAGPGWLESDVLRADGFGNLQLAARARDAERAGLTGRVSIIPGVQSRFAGRIARTFADVEPGGIGVLVDSAGHIAVVVNGGSAERTLGSPPAVRIEAGQAGDD